MKKKILLIIIAVLAVFWIIGKFIKKDETPKKETNKTEKKTESKKVIPGSVPVDVYLNLEKKGFKIDKQFSPDFKIWECTKSEAGLDYNVKVYSEDLNTIQAVRVTAATNGKEIKNIEAVKPFMIWISSLQYKGSDVPKLQKWISDNFNKDKATTTIGNVKYSIYASSPYIRTIEYTAL